ncbi:MAG TPA: cbb3-type cytochrome c oxidase subunit I [Verrucomicrobiota bacterium]|nr:cbb3-type cytochrome c oxidase subunit I [Verrucomicrobiota bacterium]
MLTGLVALFFAAGWIIAEPSILASYHYNQYVIAATHLVVLGFICTVVMGAMYQLVPVALETSLYSERLAKWQFAIHVVGFIGMVWMFNVWNMKQVGHFGSVLALGVGLFVYNMAQTLRRVSGWNVVATAISAALFWFSLTVIVGLSVATAKCAYESTEGLAAAGGVKQLVTGLRVVAGAVSQFNTIGLMHAHAHLGVLGFFVMLIVGVSYRLIPMFTLTEVSDKRRAALSILLLNVGVAGSVATILLRHELKPAFAAVTVAGLAVYAWELCAMLRARKRAALDWGLRSFLVGVAMLIPVCLIGLFLSWPGLPLTPFTGMLENVYGFLGLFGVVTLAILGMLYKMLPFLVWLRVYSPHVGRARLPLTSRMISERAQAAGLWTYIAGLTVISVAILRQSETGVRIGAILLFAALLLFGFNVAKILSHFLRPQIHPLPSPQPVSA